jgi:tyrosine-specific transport protein
MIHKIVTPISGILLVMGTCIGAGMLALPVVTGLAGFLPAITASFFCFLFMMATGLLLLEAILWLEEGVNLLSLSEHFFGRAGKWVGGFTFLFLYYCLEVSYCAGGAPALAMMVSDYLGIQVSGVASYLLFVGVFGLIVYLGANCVSKVNWILMVGLLLSFLLLIWTGSTEVKRTLLMRSSWSLSLGAMPVLFGAYGYHNLLPSLASYLKRNVAYLRLAIIFGTLLPFLIYSVWQWMIIGTLSEADLTQADLKGVPITQALQSIVGHPLLSKLGEFFGFFALVTSFLGVSLSMVDFLADGLQMPSGKRKPLLLCLLIFLPPALLAAAYPGIFIGAIGVAGGFGEAILNGLFPIGMVWMGRYVMKLPINAQLGGGKALLLLLLLFTLMIIGIEARHLYLSFLGA